MYFPAALLIKSSLTMLLLTLLAPVLFVRGLLPYRRELVFLGAGVLVFLGAGTTMLEAATRIQQVVGPDVELLPLRMGSGVERTLL